MYWLLFQWNCYNFFSLPFCCFRAWFPKWYPFWMEVVFILTASWIAHITMLFSSNPMAQAPTRNHIWIETEKPLEREKNIRKLVKKKMYLHNNQHPLLKPYDTIPLLYQPKHWNRHCEIFEYVMVIPHFSGYYCFIITTIVMLINKNGFCDLRQGFYPARSLFLTQFFFFFFIIFNSVISQNEAITFFSVDVFVLCYNFCFLFHSIALVWLLLLHHVYVTIRFCYAINWHIVATILWQHDPNEWLIHFMLTFEKSNKTNSINIHAHNLTLSISLSVSLTMNTLYIDCLNMDLYFTLCFESQRSNRISELPTDLCPHSESIFQPRCIFMSLVSNIIISFIAYGKTQNNCFILFHFIHAMHFIYFFLCVHFISLW